jgi:hypothetical protein
MAHLGLAECGTGSGFWEGIVVAVSGVLMYCDLDQAEKPAAQSDDWANDATYGWVHRLDGWHTVTGSLLAGSPRTGLLPRVETGNPHLPLPRHLPALPDEA